MEKKGIFARISESINNFLDKHEKEVEFVYKRSFFSGITIIIFIKRLKRNIQRFLEPIFKAISIEFKFRVKRIRKWYKRTVGDIFFAIRRIFVGFGKLLKAAFLAPKNKQKIGEAVKSEMSRGYTKNKEIYFRAFNYLVAVVGIGVLSAVLIYYSTLSFGLSASISTGEIGVVQNEENYRDAVAMFATRIVAVDDDEVVDTQPTYELVTSREVNYDSPAVIADKMVEVSSEEVVEASGLYVNGAFYGACFEGAELKTLLSSKLEEAAVSHPDGEVAFVKNVEVIDGLYPTESVSEYSALEGLINGTTQEEIIYEVVSGDTPIGIAAKYGISLTELDRLNGDLLDTLKPGYELTIQADQSFLQVKVIKDIVYTVDVDYDVENRSNNSLALGTSRTLQDGVDGVNEVYATVTYIDGFESGREITNTIVISEPVTRIVEIGTKSLAPEIGEDLVAGGLGTGSYGWPTASGYISNGWLGYPGHYAIDIASGYGTNIYAVDGGVVTLAQWYGSYGNCIIINHGNGMQTLYAHMSAIYVPVGTVVDKGQHIGEMGSTGRSTGTHLHIEFIENGVKKNPLLFL